MFPNPFTETEWMQSNHPILLEIAKELGSLGCDCVPTPKHPSLLWMMSNRRHIDVIHLQWPEQYYWPTMYSRLARLLSPVAHRWNLQGIVRFLYLAWVFAFVSLAKLFKLPIVWTLHDLYPHGQTSDEHYRAEHLARAYLMRNISVLILNCGSAEPLVTAEFGRPNSIVVAPLGDYRKFYPDTVSADVARHAMGVMEHDIVFLYVGTMRTHRNPLRLIQAFRDMPQKNLRLFVVGETWDDLRREMEKASWGDWRIRCLFQLAPNEKMKELAALPTVKEQKSLFPDFEKDLEKTPQVEVPSFTISEALPTVKTFNADPLDIAFSDVTLRDLAAMILLTPISKNAELNELIIKAKSNL
jgi:glycosyltransferase involved in cell wall biosynthesis